MNNIKYQIKKKIIENILDDTYKKNNIVISFSIINDKYFVLHIYNPKYEEIKINEKNKLFFEKISNMMFNKNETGKGCFNHQKDDNDKLFNSPMDVILNEFLKIEYSFILVKIDEFIPLSISCLIKNYIYNVCTNFENRGQGNMEKLMDHFYYLVKMNKLKNGNHREILLDVVFVNPDYKKVKEYYENKYNFKILEEKHDKTILKKIIE